MQNWMNTYLEAFLIVILPTLTQSTGLDFFFFFSDAKYFGLEVSPQDAASGGMGRSLGAAGSAVVADQRVRLEAGPVSRVPGIHLVWSTRYFVGFAFSSRTTRDLGGEIGSRTNAA